MVCHDQGMRKRARFGGGPWAAAKKKDAMALHRRRMGKVLTAPSRLAKRPLNG